MWLLYIGQSGRAIKTRIKEHEKSIKNNKHSIGFATHCIENKHHYDGNFQILHTFEKSSILNLFKANEINKVINSRKPITNDQIDVSSSPLLNLALHL